MKKVATLRGQWSIVLHTSPVIMQHICPGIIGSDSLRTLRQFSMMIFLLNRSMRNGVRKWKQNIVQPSGSVWTTERCLAACCKWSAWWWMMHPLVERTLYDNGPVQAVTLPSNQGGDWPWTKFVTITGLSIANRREWAWESWWLFCFFDCNVQLESHHVTIGQAKNEAICSSASLQGIYQLQSEA